MRIINKQNKGIMQMDRNEVINNAKKYAQLINQHLKTDRIVLFGSYAKGNYTENSDIDIAVIVDEITDDFLTVSKLLNKLTRNIDYRIEPVLLEKNDDRSGFLSDILLYGLILSERKEIN